MDLVRTYGDELAVLAVTGRCAQIDALGATTVLDVGEEIGCRAVVNRAVAGLPSPVGFVAVGANGSGWLPGAPDALRAVATRRPRAGLLIPRDAGTPPPPRLPFLLRRAAWDSVGGYDTRITGPQRADVDLRARLEQAGWLVLAGVTPVARP